MTPEERKQLFIDNEYLVKLIIKDHFRPKAYGCELEDLVNMGMVGLWKAAESYDPSTGYKFSTWAHWKIRGEIQGGRRPYGHSQYSHLNGRWNHTPLSQIDSHYMAEKSGDDANAGYLLVAEETREPSDEQCQAELEHSVQEALKNLEPLEYKVIKARMEGIPLEVIGDEIGYSGERVRQIELKAKRRLKLNQTLRDVYYKKQ